MNHMTVGSDKIQACNKQCAKDVDISQCLYKRTLSLLTTATQMGIAQNWGGLCGTLYNKDVQGLLLFTPSLCLWVRVGQLARVSEAELLISW